MPQDITTKEAKLIVLKTLEAILSDASRFEDTETATELLSTAGRQLLAKARQNHLESIRGNITFAEKQK